MHYIIIFICYIIQDSHNNNNNNTLSITHALKKIHEITLIINIIKKVNQNS